MMLIDIIINDIGYGKYQIISIINAFLILMTLGSYLAVVPTLIMSLKTYLNINNDSVTLLLSGVI